MRNPAHHAKQTDRVCLLEAEGHHHATPAYHKTLTSSSAAVHEDHTCLCCLFLRAPQALCRSEFQVHPCPQLVLASCTALVSGGGITTERIFKHNPPPELVDRLAAAAGVHIAWVSKCRSRLCRLQHMQDNMMNGAGQKSR
jgi:hypothetical protein